MRCGTTRAASAWTGTASGIETKLLSVSCAGSRLLLGLPWLPSPHGRTTPAARSSPGARRVGRARHRRNRRCVSFDEVVVRCCQHVRELVDHDVAVERERQHRGRSVMHLDAGSNRGSVLSRHQRRPSGHHRRQGRRTAGLARHRRRRVRVPPDHGRRSRHLALRRGRPVLRVYKAAAGRRSCAGRSSPTPLAPRPSTPSTPAGTRVGPSTST